MGISEDLSLAQCEISRALIKRDLHKVSFVGRYYNGGFEFLFSLPKDMDSWKHQSECIDAALDARSQLLSMGIHFCYSFSPGWPAWD